VKPVDADVEEGCCVDVFPPKRDELEGADAPNVNPEEEVEVLAVVDGIGMANENPSNGLVTIGAGGPWCCEVVVVSFIVDVCSVCGVGNENDTGAEVVVDSTEVALFEESGGGRVDRTFDDKIGAEKLSDEDEEL
jgi:hypothetical protein